MKYARELTKDGEIRATVKKPSTCRATLLQVLGCRFAVFTLHDQLVAQQKHLLRVEESGLIPSQMNIRQVKGSSNALVVMSAKAKQRIHQTVK